MIKLIVNFTHQIWIGDSYANPATSEIVDFESIEQITTLSIENKLRKQYPHPTITSIEQIKTPNNSKDLCTCISRIGVNGEEHGDWYCKSCNKLIAK